MGFWSILRAIATHWVKTGQKAELWLPSWAGRQLTGDSPVASQKRGLSFSYYDESQSVPSFVSGHEDSIWVGCSHPYFLPSIVTGGSSIDLVILFGTSIPEDMYWIQYACGRLAHLGMGGNQIVYVHLSLSREQFDPLKKLELLKDIRSTSVVVDPRAAWRNACGGFWDEAGIDKPKSQFLDSITQIMLERQSQLNIQKTEANIDWRQLEEDVCNQIWIRLKSEKNAITAQELHQKIETELFRALRNHHIGSVPGQKIQTIIQNISDQILGYGPLEKFLKDPELNEIMINGPQKIYLEKGGRVDLCPEKFIDEPQLKSVIERLVGKNGRRVDTSSPMCDLRLNDGSRVNVVLPPISLNGPLLTIRRFPALMMTMEEWNKSGSMTEEDSRFLMEHVSAHKNILIAGNTGSGKTTLLNILSGYISDRERIITLEDAAELKITKPHVIRMETRPPNLEGRGEITMKQLVINAMRMRPDRLIIGECRGDEVIPMLQALNTGHAGSMSTIHSNSARDALNRMESMVLMGSHGWPLEVIRRLIASAIHIVVFLERIGSQRKLVEILEVSRVYESKLDFERNSKMILAKSELPKGV